MGHGYLSEVYYNSFFHSNQDYTGSAHLVQKYKLNRKALSPAVKS